jgi:hypothetical protein
MKKAAPVARGGEIAKSKQQQLSVAICTTPLPQDQAIHAELSGSPPSIFVLQLEGKPGAAGIRDLRALLKHLLRCSGFRCTGAREITTNHELPAAARRRRMDERKRAEKETSAMDMREFIGSAFLKPGDVKDGPIKVAITDIVEGKFGKPDLVFDDGTRLSCNVTNARVLARAYGTDSKDWIGKEVELSLGETEYQGQPKASVLVKPISPPIKKAVPNDPPIKKKAVPVDPSMDDEVPFRVGGKGASGRKSLMPPI